MSATYIDKQPDEIVPVSVSFVNVLPTGETLQNTSSVTATLEGVSVPGFMTGSPTISSPVMTVTITGGSAGSDYKLSFFGKTQNYTFEYDVIVQVRAI